MEQKKLSDRLTCEQVYSVWSTEPELIQILDLRRPEAFNRYHIPGAVNVTPGDLDGLILRLDGKLGLIVAPEDMISGLEQLYGHFRDVAILKDCDRWLALKYPVAGAETPRRTLAVEMINGIPEVRVEDVRRNHGKVRLVDVRRPDEFDGELGHIPDAELVTLGPDLTEFLKNGDPNQEIIFVCRSGARSGHATLESIKMGYALTANMTGGMIRWRELYAD
jgi:rhodanese-related sulfurtransferase